MDLGLEFAAIEGPKLVAEFLRSPRAVLGVDLVVLLLRGACGFQLDTQTGRIGEARGGGD